MVQFRVVIDSNSSSTFSKINKRHFVTITVIVKYSRCIYKKGETKKPRQISSETEKKLIRIEKKIPRKRILTSVKFRVSTCHH